MLIFIFSYEKYQCGYAFANCGLADVWVGLILLAISIAMLTGCLVMLVRLMTSFCGTSLPLASTRRVQLTFFKPLSTVLSSVVNKSQQS